MKLIGVTTGRAIAVAAVGLTAVVAYAGLAGGARAQQTPTAPAQAASRGKALVTPAGGLGGRMAHRSGWRCGGICSALAVVRK